MDKIRRLSSRLRLVFLAAIVLVPALQAWGWGTYEWTAAKSQSDVAAMMVLGRGTPPVMDGPVTPLMRLLGFAAAMLPGAADMYGFLCLARLFRRFGRGEVFSAATVGLLHRLGWALLAAQGLSVMQGMLTSLILTMDNLPGRHVLTLSLDSATLSGVLTGVIVILASRIMDEARRLREEQDLVI